ncbi:MAG: OmpH family outer membrane protein [Vulcanimicrobiaceae bacterium]
MKKQALFLALSAALLAGCSNSSPIGIVDVDRITQNWPVFQNDQQNLFLDEQKIQTSKVSADVKRRQALALEQKYGAITLELTNQLQDAAKKVAAAHGLKLAVTRQGVGYGGTDITADVEKELGITEKSTPTPSP